jgi:hypothetical protein
VTFSLDLSRPKFDNIPEVFQPLLRADMGFDISSHPMDVSLIQTRILPYLRGQGNLDDLITEAVRLAKVRFRANAWGLGLVQLQSELQALTTY